MFVVPSLVPIKPALVLSGYSLTALHCYSVYAWIRGGRYLYVGRSESVLVRLGTHNIIGTAANPLLATDRIAIWHFEIRRDSMKFEYVLINQFKPELNCSGKFSKL